MGCNYYAQWRTETGWVERKHIGKSSMGWTFSFRGYRPPEYIDDNMITSWGEWKDFLSRDGVEIFDESHRPINFHDFVKLVEYKRDAEFNHTQYCRVHHPEYAQRDCWLDDEGNSFSGSEFS